MKLCKKSSPSTPVSRALLGISLRLGGLRHDAEDPNTELCCLGAASACAVTLGHHPASPGAPRKGQGWKCSPPSAGFGPCLEANLLPTFPSTLASRSPLQGLC